MYKKYLPRNTYLYSAAAYLYVPARWVVENVWTNGTFWNHYVQPFFEPLLWPYIPIFVSGLLIQDLYNPRSWIRQVFKSITSTFDVVSHQVIYADNPKRLQINCRIKFKTDIKSGKLIARCFGGTNGPIKPIISVVVLADLNDKLKDQFIDIVLGKAAISYAGWTPVYSVWGDTDMAKHDVTMPMGCDNILNLELHSGWRVQVHKFYISSRAYFSPIDMPNLHVQSEDEDVFSAY